MSASERATTAGVIDALRAASSGEGWRVSFVDADGLPCPAQAFLELTPPAFADVTFDSRAVTPGSLFVCKGATFREQYLIDAASRGAAAYLAERAHPSCGLPGVVCADVRRAMAHAADAFFGHPSGDLRLVAVTGTKGKTTVAFYVDAILRSRVPARRSALLTGVVLDDGVSRTHADNTTPEAVELQRHLANAVAAGCDAGVMEASSQGFKYDRTLCARFAVGVFTNIGEDHVSPHEHPTFEDYFASKLRIFGQSDVGVVDLDADHATRILDAARAACPRVVTYSLHDAAADVRLSSCEHLGQGLWRLGVVLPGGRGLQTTLPALGSFNVSNALAAAAACDALGVDADAIARGLSVVRVPGRMERHDAPDGSLVGIVDYAHNEMSMRAALSCLRQEFPDRELTVVFGSCGTRGVDRRPGLGRAAAELADRVILTEDDPGPVSVSSICEEIASYAREAGGDPLIVCDRPAAVHAAVEGAHRPAVVLLAGKGAEDSILRASGRVPCRPDAGLFCDEVGVPFEGYAGLYEER